MVSRLVRLALAIVVVWSIWFVTFYDRTPAHHIATADRDFNLSPHNFTSSSSSTSKDASRHEFYASDGARDFCAAHGYPVFVPVAASGERKIYDLFMVNTELDHLEIRLNTLYDYVDYFVVVESPITFQGGEKPMMVYDNWARFARYHDKMIYHKLSFPPDFNPKLTWDVEALQRNAMYEQVFPTLQDGARAPIRGDVIIVSDVDEIPRPSSLLVLRACTFPRRLTLASKFYYYSFQFLHTGKEWQHPQATYYQGFTDTLKPSDLRRGKGGVPLLRKLEEGTLANASWHCSSCFSTVEEFLTKMASFSHKWMNGEEYRDKDRIAAAVRQGEDLWGRRQDKFVRVDGNLDMPQVLLEKEGDKFAYMRSRDGKSAGFTDYP